MLAVIFVSDIFT